MKQLFVVFLIMLGVHAAEARNGETEPKGKDGKKDSTAPKSDIENKGFRNLFNSDVF